MTTAEPEEILSLDPPLPGEIPVGRVPMGRLAFRPGLPISYSSELIAANILNAPADAVFFCDSNMFIGPTHDDIWKALLTRKVAIVPEQIEELKSWFENPQRNLIAHAEYTKLLNKESCSFEVFHYGDDPTTRAILEYYCNLLGLRKRLTEIVTEQLASQLNREPSPNEVESTIKKHFGERAYQRAKKGDELKDKKNFFVDEIIVVTAMVTAIGLGLETIVLTHDSDLQEQIYKLFWLIDTHYRAMLFARAYFDDPQSFVARKLSKDNPRVKQAFTGEDDIFIEPKARILDEILPENPQFAMLYSWLVTGNENNLKFCPDSYCVEKQMMELLNVKGKTKGLNTTRFDGKNCHIWLSPLPLAGAVIAKESRQEVGSTLFSLLDFQHALSTDERLRHIEIRSIELI